ncbi:MAG TPA: cobyrinate a,c-diamide synthase [Streptosporangiaceae bacterium]|jgi:cobyrinic acid a,c-diamide synthase
MITPPRLVIAATRSGDGKTTVATGLMAALRAAGHRVSGHKIGPDYIDPGYHAAAAGRPGRTLDPWLTSEEMIAPLLRHGAAGADIAIIEGVMGLFDGAAGRGGFASTAHVAGLLDAPVVLVVSAAGAARSVAATVHGFATFDPGVRLAGVIVNQVSSARHERLLADGLAEAGVRLLGALPRAAALHTPSRHLGLVPAAERARQVSDWLTALRELITAHLDIAALVAIARQAPALPGPAWSPAPAAAEPARVAGRPPRIAVAAGRAFTFGYTEHAEMLTAAGAELAGFDPMTDSQLPAGTDALVIGGGFPEVYARELSANTTLRAQVRERAAAGMPVVAECAGLLWLGARLDGLDQCGVLPATATMTGSLTLGYREATALRASPLLPAGAKVRGHEFHRTVSQPGHGPGPAWRLANGSRQGWASPSLLASYLHLHWAGQPGAAARLAAAARRARLVPA